MAIPEIELAWLNEQAATNEVPIEKMTAWYDASVIELKDIGLDKAFGGEDNEQFTDAVRAAVRGRLQENISVPPTEFEIMIVGPYPERPVNKNKVQEYVAYVSLDGGPPENASVSAWGDDDVALSETVEYLGAYKTGFSYFPQDKQPGRFKLTIQPATILDATSKCDFLGDNYEARLDLLRQSVPHVKLNEAGHNTSSLIRSKNDKTYPDSLDIKKIIVQVEAFSDGIDKNGKHWARYSVIDGTFQSTIKNRTYTVWVDFALAKRIGAGKGSYLEIYGMIQNDRDNTTNMSACFIHPLAIKPMEVQESQMQKDQAGGNVQVPSAPQIKVVHEGTGM